MKKMLRSEFLCGAVTAAMVQSLAQDYVGREAYVKWTSITGYLVIGQCLWRHLSSCLVLSN